MDQQAGQAGTNTYRQPPPLPFVRACLRAGAGHCRCGILPYTTANLSNVRVGWLPGRPPRRLDGGPEVPVYGAIVVPSVGARIERRTHLCRNRWRSAVCSQVLQEKIVQILDFILAERPEEDRWLPKTATPANSKLLHHRIANRLLSHTRDMLPCGALFIDPPWQPHRKQTGVLQTADG